MTSQQFDGSFVGTSKYRQTKYRYAANMALTDTFTKKVKSKESLTGVKHGDGQGMYLHVTNVGKYWRMAYRFNESLS